MRVYFTYDTRKARNDLKKELLKTGFLDFWQANNKTCYLPDTTLWHPNMLDVTTAKRNFFNIVEKVNENRAQSDKNNH